MQGVLKLLSLKLVHSMLVFSIYSMELCIFVDGMKQILLRAFLKLGVLFFEQMNININSLIINKIENISLGAGKAQC